VLGNLFDLGRDSFGFLERCERDYGDAVYLELGTAWPTLMLNGSDLIEEVLVKKNESFRKNSFFWRQVSALFGKGLLTSDGDLWRTQRRLAAPAFAARRILSYAPIMVASVERMLEDWHDGDVRDVYRDTMVATLRIASRTMFGFELDSEVSAMGEAVDLLSEEIGNRFARPFLIPDWLPTPGNARYRRGIAHVEKVVSEIIEDRRVNDPDKGDLLSMLIMARDEDGAPMSDRQLRDEAVTLLLAGHETTALSLSWTLLLLARHPEVQDAIAAECAAVIEPGRQVTPDDLPKLPQLEHALIEALRLYPPVWVIGREAREEVRIGGYVLPERTQIMMCSWVVQRSPRNFEAPTEFRPARWAGDFRKRLPRFAYFPFSGGARICIGERFAMMETMLLLATLLPRFRVTPRDDRPVEPTPSITLRPKGGIWLRVEERKR
jgi:cytochrome P450